MKAVNIAPVDSIGGRRTHTNAVERWEEQKRLVLLVIAAYRGVSDLQPIVAFNQDPDRKTHANKWSPDSCHYKVDVQNCVRRIIEAKPESEHSALWAAWNSLLTDDYEIGNVEQRLIKLLAGQMYRKRLHPGLYFRRNKYPVRQRSR